MRHPSIEQFGLKRIKRWRHVLEPLSPRNQGDLQAEAVELLFEYIYPPPVKCDHSQIQAIDDFGDVAGNMLVVDRCAWCRSEKTLSHPHVVWLAVSCRPFCNTLLWRPEKRANLPNPINLANQDKGCQVSPS